MAMSPPPNPLPRERVRGGEAVQVPWSGHSQAAPRTPLESPCIALRIGVSHSPPKTHCFTEVRHRLIQPFDVAHPAAQHDNVRVEDIHHVGQRFRQPLFIAAQRQFSLFVTFSHRGA